ncbi:hypothetical protein COT97_02000 [Candidatus Falkowbacteria bacterium CG10_big_fil_rev_8_21_14_0_10_39_11]|uniref:Uncharacterized protein n=1 Tax=Candidatus Falkowbacteria bacterium CG10_big_fil_rev_8_21_14_0_10_39_11 TaxID=1974565 RepID=A0A2H0V591_9BACT|nr:MAG: hypothetical protein COT97_02000 [Candidatus Falkowbacteria bacterium CG10_big_fil_rev_8_21_14_0_10_39_11]
MFILMLIIAIMLSLISFSVYFYFSFKKPTTAHHKHLTALIVIIIVNILAWGLARGYASFSLPPASANTFGHLALLLMCMLTGAGLGSVYMKRKLNPN